MNQIQLVTIPVTTSAGGAFSTTIVAPSGRLLQYRYVPHASTPLDTGADIDLVGATTGFVYVNQDNIGTTAFQKLPRHKTQDETGADSLYAAADAASFIEDKMMAGPEQLTFTVAAGGDTKLGTFYFWFG